MRKTKIEGQNEHGVSRSRQMIGLTEVETDFGANKNEFGQRMQTDNGTLDRGDP